MIRDVTLRPHTTDPTFLDLRRWLATVMIGKPLVEVKVGRLAGSSGIPLGFNAALEQIRTQATQGDDR
ncbi:hypothetical protein [Deinococcus aestuarii]|uniref:hypothetical protein n=1 Tax=Deinococcus aestuarii TaxID=2774531 RepID=UPI001C0B7480|nr:hypothetical protein [Deinococcus aestuarii]